MEKGISGVIFIFKTKLKEYFLRLLCEFFFFLLYLLLSLLLFWFGNRESHPRVYIYFYDRKMTFRCVCDLCTMTTTTKTTMKKLFQINSKCCPNDRCCCWFYCPYFHRQHYRRALFLRIGNRFMSFYFHFFLHSLPLSLTLTIINASVQRHAKLLTRPCFCGVCHFHFRCEKHSNYVLMLALKTLSYYILVIITRCKIR